LLAPMFSKANFVHELVAGWWSNVHFHLTVLDVKAVSEMLVH
jgi:hypothetical protein